MGADVPVLLCKKERRDALSFRLRIALMTIDMTAVLFSIGESALSSMEEPCTKAPAAMMTGES